MGGRKPMMGGIQMMICVSCMWEGTRGDWRMNGPDTLFLPYPLNFTHQDRKGRLLWLSLSAHQGEELQEGPKRIQHQAILPPEGQDSCWCVYVWRERISGGRSMVRNKWTGSGKNRRLPFFPCRQTGSYILFLLLFLLTAICYASHADRQAHTLSISSSSCTETHPRPPPAAVPPAPTAW